LTGGIAHYARSTAGNIAFTASAVPARKSDSPENKMKKIAFLTTIILSLASPALAQEESMNMAGMENSVGFLSSGTSIEPRATSEFSPMIHKTLGNWVFMFHANAFVVGTQQSGPRGRDKAFFVNWFMPMLARKSGASTISFRTMLSLEPATVTQRRYPLLFQTGEEAFGREIIDGQHPHDLVMELAARYDYAFSDSTQFFLYAGPVGEPALGPTAFPHRASASENPVAVLGHHQQDSTHISNSVVTLGFAGGPVQLEASTFHGREPNENRWNFDGGKPDSFASRLSFSAGNTLSGQFSVGRINNREPSEPGMDTLRTTASLHHNVRFSGGHVASSLIWGRNKDMHNDERHIFNAYTLESTVNFKSQNWIWTRIENVDLHETDETPAGRIQAWTVGYERELPTGSVPLRVGLGAQATFYGLAPQLKPIYGDRPAGLSFFLRVRPKGNMMLHMQSMHQH
jgi:hypothetical protein